MTTEINIKELTAKAFFDYVGPAFPAWWGKNKTAFVLPSLSNIRASLSGQAGKGYFMTLTLADSNGTQYNFPNEPLVSLSLRKTIKETPTVGKYRKGTVKEYINTEDYNITLRGVCIDTENPNRYPAEQIQELNALFEKNEALEVVDNMFFAQFGIDKVVLKDIALAEMAGQEGVQKYTIKAVSDQDFYAELTERNAFLKG